MSKAVRFDQYGEIEVLEVVEVDRPSPGRGEVLVEVRAAGINPGESAIRRGDLDDVWPATFPSGEGTDFAGVIVEVGAGVGDFAVDDEVLGFTDNRASHAEVVVAKSTNIVAKPGSVSWEVAGALRVAGTTAYGVLDTVDVSEGDVVVVSGAAGGVGSITVQLAVERGATVIGLASESNHEWLAARGVVPVDYHDEGLSDRLIEAAGGRVDAFIDTFGDGYVALALQLDVAPERIVTTIDFATAEESGARSVQGSDYSSAAVLGELAAMLADGRVEIPIAAVYSLDDVRDAFRELEERHTHGKIVLAP